MRGDHEMLKPLLNFLPQGQQGHALLPWVIGVMIYLTALALFTGVSIHSGLNKWSAGLNARISVQITAANADERGEETANALDVLNKTPGIKNATLIADQDVMALITPWLGDIQDISGLPIPSLIDVELENANSLDIEALKVRLKNVAPHARLDDHQGWMGEVLILATTLRTIAMLLMAMVMLCTIAIVVFGCRAGLATHKKGIKLMHLMGAEDKVIAREFDRSYLIYGLKGSVGGTALAVITLFALARLMENVGEGLLTNISPDQNLVLALMVLPVFGTLLTLWTARITVRRALKVLV